LYKYDTKKKLLQHDFQSVQAMLRYIENGSFNDNFFHRASEIGDYEFSLTESYNEAHDLCKRGALPDEIEKANEMIDELKQTKIYTIPKRYSNFVGFAPNVPAYLQGNPKNMYDIRKEKRKKIDVYYGAESSGRTSTDDIYLKGITTMGLIKLLEENGFNVNLKFFAALENGKQRFLTRLLLKEEKERLDIASSFVPMCHPAFSRRIVPRLLEITPDADQMWQKSYGLTCSEYTSRYLLDAKENDILINDLASAKEWFKNITEGEASEQLREGGI